MKFTILSALLMFSSLSFAETIFEKNNKKEMLERVELMMEKMSIARKELKQEKVEEACKLVNELEQIYVDHIVDIGSHMHLYEKRVNELLFSVMNIRFPELLNQINVCSLGDKSVHVDPKKMSKALKNSQKSLKRQERIIKKYATDLDDNFHFSYRWYGSDYKYEFSY